MPRTFWSPLVKVAILGRFCWKDGVYVVVNSEWSKQCNRWRDGRQYDGWWSKWCRRYWWRRCHSRWVKCWRWHSHAGQRINGGRPWLQPSHACPPSPHPWQTRPLPAWSQRRRRCPCHPIYAGLAFHHSQIMLACVLLRFKWTLLSIHLSCLSVCR